MRKVKAAIEYMERLRRLKESGINEHTSVNDRIPETDLESISSLDQRIHRIFNIINSTKRPIENMLFFIMYDIESNKVRYNIVKYLLRKGCTRIQKSIFLADLSTATYHEIRHDLTEIQSLYDNHDSIIICPISTDQLRSMKVIGKNIDLDLITHNRNTLFF